MQNTTLSIQSNGQAPAPQRASVNPNADAGQFSAALSREIEQRHEAPPPQPPAQQKNAAQPQSSQQEPEQPAAADKAPAPEPAHQPHPQKTDAKKSGKSADDDAGDKGKNGHPATAQVTDMLALVASLKPLQDAAAAKVAGAHVAGAASSAIGKAGGADAAHLAALQAAAKALGKDTGQQAAGVSQDPLKHTGTDPLSAAADHKAAGHQAVDLRAGFDAQLKAHTDPAKLRDALADVAALKEPAPAAPLAAQVQPAALEVAQAAAGVAGDRIAARVGTPDWQNQVGQKIVWMVAGEEQSASLTLNPPDLGPLQVVLNVHNDQASVTFSSNQQEVRQALENALPRLREMMGESGIALGNASVNAGNPGQQQPQFGEQPRGSHSAGVRFDGGASIADTPRPAARTTVLGGRGAVDTFA